MFPRPSPSPAREAAANALKGAKELLYRQDETSTQFGESIAILLTTAAELALRTGIRQCAAVIPGTQSKVSLQ